jgi:hypothetical protein|tara:strand:+ start:1402 stop:2205 length:804 start_codon:yes stop_codon:yes gene_type:complete
MRRGQLSEKSVIFVIIAGFFALLSISLDQNVIQKEDTIRNIEISIQNKHEEVNELDANYLSVIGIEDRANALTSYHSFYSTLYYKIYLNLDDSDFKKHFNEYAKEYISAFINYDLVFVIEDLSKLKEQIESMSFYYYEYQDKEIQNKVKSLFVYENPLNKTILEKINNAKDLQYLNLPSEETYEIYRSLFHLNKQFAISIKKIIDIRNYFFDKTEIAEKELDLLLKKGKKNKIEKNFFILTSILAQILSLMMLLFLFRNIIKVKTGN